MLEPKDAVANDNTDDDRAIEIKVLRIISIAVACTIILTGVLLGYTIIQLGVI